MKRCPSCQSAFPTNYTHCPRDGSALAEAGEWAEGTIVRGKYQILSKVGQGGMAAVYKALHIRFKELRALKVMSPELAGDPTFVKRFEQEAIVTRSLQHPNAVRVEDIDEAEDGRPFIVMEYVEGGNLKDVIEREAPMPVARVCSIVKQIAAALDAAHSLGLIHRDIKPANIALVASRDKAGRLSDHVKVLDFGIAKLKEAHLEDSKVHPLSHMTMTGTGMVIGTPAYMSPEQAKGLKGEQLDGRSDLYALGVVMYQMLTGDLPLKADSTLELLMAHISTPPKPIQEIRPDLKIPAAVAAVVMRCLEKNRELRPATGQELINEIKSPADRGPALSGEPWAATRKEQVAASLPSEMSAPQTGRHSGPLQMRSWLFALVLIAGAAAVLVVWITLHAGHTNFGLENVLSGHHFVLEHVLSGHQGPVNTVAFSPSGELLASGSFDNTIKLWDVMSGREVRTMKGDDGYQVRRVGFSPDGRWLASVSENPWKVRLWETSSGREVIRLNDSYSSAFSANGRWLAVAGFDRIEVLDANQGWDAVTVIQQKHNVAGDSDLAFSPDDHYLATAYEDKIRLWQVGTWRGADVFDDGDRRKITRFSFSRDSQWLVTVGSAGYQQTAFGTSTNQQLKLWHLDPAHTAQTLWFGNWSPVVISGNARWLAWRSHDQKITLWQVPATDLAFLSNEDSNPLAFSFDGLLLCSNNYDRAEGTLRIWDVATGRELDKLTGHTYPISDAAFSADGRSLASASADKTVRLWRRR
jgi:serine/threonine protein kinase/WD40 repeat protein